MLQTKILARLLILTLVLAPAAYAANEKVQLTTFFPISYGEYTNLKSTGSAYFATAAGENVGIATTTPADAARLDVAGEIHSSDTASGFFLGGGGATDSWVRLTTNADFGYHDLAVGSFWAKNGAISFDLAEVTPVKEEDQLSQGEVVVTDSDKGLRVTRSTRPYDTSVLGIVSSYEQAAMVIGAGVGPENAAKTKDRLPVALIGRVKAKVSAENGAIKAGDLLTTSSTPGHLMKCDDLTKCIGAVAAKAFGPWEKDTGTIEVLVTLQ
jgi:hypothetical protein